MVNFRLEIVLGLHGNTLVAGGMETAEMGSVRRRFWLQSRDLPVAHENFGSILDGAGISLQCVKTSCCSRYSCCSPWRTQPWSMWIFPKGAVVHGEPTVEQVDTEGLPLVGTPPWSRFSWQKLQPMEDPC